MLSAEIVTEKGTISVDLFSEQTPITVANFVNLASRGFYDNLNFHRVIQDFMIQGGCPSGNGMGGPGYRFADEFLPELRHDSPGKLSMANAGPGTNGSQFFITHVPTPHLDDAHTIFGSVKSEEDQKIVDQIEQGDQIQTIKIVGEYEELLSSVESVSEWNDVLDSDSDS
jgi:peptidyl-prolyl cis-trans isomerase B (cyclophilin B)|tara:strand:- start:410 stop:919 length:510 start_codon:yes stop_codon:yes gene_type:complete